MSYDLIITCYDHLQFKFHHNKQLTESIHMCAYVKIQLIEIVVKFVIAGVSASICTLYTHHTYLIFACFYSFSKDTLYTTLHCQLQMAAAELLYTYVQ